jgi:SAM-dependent methyltransferase
LANRATRPDWQLPRGVTRALLEHAQLEDVSAAYDEQFSRGAPRELDEQVLDDLLRPPGVVVDLGAGSGRLALPLARRGLRCVAVDLSRPALVELNRQSAAEDLPIDCILANLVELDGLRDGVADYCISMYSTVGMIRGRENRLQFLRHVRRILKPGGRFVVHAHNRWFNLFLPQSRSWLLKNLLRGVWRRDTEAGDKYFAYHGVPNMYLHVFTRSELLSDLAAAGFAIEKVIPLSVERHQPLRMPWLFGRLRAGGWIVVCR